MAANLTFKRGLCPFFVLPLVRNSYFDQRGDAAPMDYPQVVRGRGIFGRMCRGR